MRRIAVLVLAISAMTVLPASAQVTTSSTTSTTTVAPAVTVEPGPSHTASYVPPCSDLGRVIEEQLAFVLRRTGPATVPLTVTYTLTGSAQVGVYYDPLPGSVTFPAGASSVTVPVTPRATTTGGIVQLTLTVTSVAGSPSATIQFVSPPLPGTCGYGFTVDSWNTAQTVAVGETLRRLSLQEFTPPVEGPAEGNFRLVSGALPPGVSLRGDGSFTGGATSAGTFSAHIEACRPAPPTTCVTTDLQVTVVGTGRTLPRTGPGRSTPVDLALALLLLSAGAFALSRGGRPEGR